MRPWVVVLGACALFPSCAGSTRVPPPDDPPVGLRPSPLTVEEVDRAVAARGSRISACYQRLRLSYGLDAPSSYVVRVRVPSDGSPPVASVVEATVEGQEALEACIVGELEALAFPAHVGGPIAVDVPIRAPKR